MSNTNANAKPEDQLITEAVNTQGIFFKRAVRMALERIKGVEILGEEYPITYCEGGAIDLLVGFTVPTWNNRFVLPIECKRAYVSNKRWVFFESPDRHSKLFYKLTGERLDLVSFETRFTSETKLCNEGIEIELGIKKNDPESKANPDPIWRAANQTCKGALGFVNQEYRQRQGSNDIRPQASILDFSVCAVLVTTAPLSVCPLGGQKVDLATGNHQGDMQLQSVDWLVLQHPYTPMPETGAYYNRTPERGYSSHKDRSYSLKEGVLVVNSGSFAGFFNMLRNLTE
jgi:hypothetical protein